MRPSRRGASSQRTSVAARRAIGSRRTQSAFGIEKRRLLPLLPYPLLQRRELGVDLFLRLLPRDLGLLGLLREPLLLGESLLLRLFFGLLLLFLCRLAGRFQCLLGG